jgi:UDPglucose--hexose-1-phosphate uridylyltransferase
MTLYRIQKEKADGRIFHQYSRSPFPADFSFTNDGLLRPTDWAAPKLRYNEMRGEWVAISTSRNNRPFLPPEKWCPLCPESDPQFPTEVPASNRLYEWAVFENMFPALAPGESGPARCEVVLYSSHHHSTLGDEPLESIEGLIEVWQDRSRTLAQEGHAQVFIFENKGAEIGVTLHHPHGQIYAFSQIPPFLMKEHLQAHTFHKETGKCHICSIVEKEIQAGSRLVLETERLVAFVPFAARYPYEVHISTKNHRPLVEHLDARERRELAWMLKTLIHKYDGLFGFAMPYILCHHQSPSTNPSDATYHWHLELYPPYRSKDKLKYLAGVESGTGFFVNDTLPEAKAQELRNCPLSSELISAQRKL